MRWSKLSRSYGSSLEPCAIHAAQIIAKENGVEQPSICDTLSTIIVRINTCCPSDDVRTELLLDLVPYLVGTRGENNQGEFGYAMIAHRRARMFINWAMVHLAYLDLRVYNDVCAILTGLTNSLNRQSQQAGSLEERDDVWRNGFGPLVEFVRDELIPVYRKPMQDVFTLEEYEEPQVVDIDIEEPELVDAGVVL